MVQEMQRILGEAPLWDRDGDWLAVRAATAKLLEVGLPPSHPGLSYESLRLLACNFRRLCSRCLGSVGIGKEAPYW